MDPQLLDSTTPLGLGQSPLEWWQGYEETPNGGILAAIAIKLYAAAPHSMADERTMSVVTMINTAQRNRQKVDSVMLRKNSRPNPTIKFFDVERLLRPIDSDDDDEGAACTVNLNYDESEDEEDINLKMLKGATATGSISLSKVLPVVDDCDTEIDSYSAELEDVLADKPITKNIKASSVGSIRVADKEDETGGTFELGEWI